MNAHAIKHYEQSDEQTQPGDDTLAVEVMAVDQDVDASLDLVISNENQGASSEASALSVRDPLAVYMRDTKRFPILSREEEHELAVQLVETGDSSAARRLVESNLRLVVKIAYEYRRAHETLLDMVQEGNIGLLHAVSKYDPHRGVKLSSYAAWWIRAYMLKFILNNHRLVKVGTTQAQRKLFFNLRKERDRLESQGFSADSESLARALDVREKDVVEMQKRLSAHDASLDAPLSTGDDGGLRTRHDIFAGAEGERPDEVVEESEFHALLKQKVGHFANTLEGREERIFRERWLAEEPMKLHELGSEFGVSRERTRQLEKRLLGRVRKFLEDELGTAVNIGAKDRGASGVSAAMGM